MRLLYVHERLGALAGAEANAHITATELGRRGHTMGLLHGPSTGKNLAAWETTFPQRFPLIQSSAREATRAALDTFQPDVVYVHKMADLMVYSHTISLASFKTVGGAPYGWEECTPGSEHDPLPWKTFFQACKDIGYDGLFSHEQCSPIIVEGHQLGTCATVDTRYVESRNYFRGIFDELGVYTGNRPMFIDPETGQATPTAEAPVQYSEELVPG